jgi:FKBP12-rapamycin complex-associated protein
LLICENDSSERQQPTHRLLNALLTFGPNLEEYLHLVIPVVVKVFEKDTNSVPIRKQAIQLIGKLCRTINISDQSSRIVHPLVRILGNESIEIREVCMDTICSILYQMKHEFIIFLPMIEKVLQRHQIIHETYSTLSALLVNGESLPVGDDNNEETRYFISLI